MEKESKMLESGGGIGQRTRLVSLAILFGVNLINYMDRLTVSAVLIVRCQFFLKVKLKNVSSQKTILMGVVV